MSCFRCYKCDNLIDSDYDGCEEHPHIEGECVCENCFAELNNNDGPGDEYYENSWESMHFEHCRKDTDLINAGRGHLIR